MKINVDYFFYFFYFFFIFVFAHSCSSLHSFSTHSRAFIHTRLNTYALIAAGGLVEHAEHADSDLPGQPDGAGTTNTVWFQFYRANQ